MYCLDRVVKTRAAAPRQSVWQPGKRVLRVAFRNGSPRLYGRILKSAQVWSEHCGIVFEPWVSWHTADIRVNIANDGNSWSYLGNQAQAIPTGSPTMHFGWLDDGSDDETLNRVVQHEFGHALGLIHEHQNPAGGIQWNREFVYELYGGPPSYWDRSVVDTNILNVYDVDMTNFSAFDPCSIMLYPVSAEMTLDGFSVGWNNCISEQDAAFVALLYPKK